MFAVKTSKQVKKFLAKLVRKELINCIEAFDELSKNPFLKRPKCDIKKLSGKEEAYRLRVGKNRFNYIIMENKIIIVAEGFRRGRGYRQVPPSALPLQINEKHKIFNKCKGIDFYANCEKR